jgi:putative ABC transport system ATP-binding protein
MTDFVSQLVSASKVFDAGGDRVVAVDGATVSVSPGETVGVVGPSGSGKTTLLSLMGMLQPPSSGGAFFQGSEVSGIPAAERRRLRLTKVGFVFQQLRLIQTLSVVENVELPMVIAGAPHETRRRKALSLVESVGLAGKERRRPGQLSVGEQQRVAVARALANDPALVLADEPTSQLDSSSGARIVELLVALRERVGAAVVVSTHDPRICEKLGRVYGIADGVVSPQ